MGNIPEKKILFKKTQRFPARKVTVLNGIEIVENLQT